jgi:hypothetical protein
MEPTTSHPNTVHGTSLIVLQDVPHRSPQDVEKSVGEIAKIVDEWIDAHSDTILSALKDLRYKLALKYKGDAFAQSLDSGADVSESMVTETSSVSVPIPMNDAVVVKQPMPIIQEEPYKEMPANFVEMGTVSPSEPEPEQGQNHADEVSLADNSLQFSRLVGGDMHLNDKLNKQEKISKYSKDILLLLCKMSLY